MKLEIDKNEVLCVAQMLRVLNNCRWLDDSGQAVTGREAIRINNEMNKAINLYNRFMIADQGGLKTGEEVKEEEDQKEEDQKEEENTEKSDKPQKNKKKIKKRNKL